jgi:uncharacterized delta-60 repeat protein
MKIQTLTRRPAAAGTIAVLLLAALTLTVLAVPADPGALDQTFNVRLLGHNDWPGQVSALAELPDGKILLGGDTSDWLSCRLQRLLSDGNLDPLFDPGTGPNDFVSALQLSADGRLWIAGGFTSFNGHPAEGVARLHVGPTVPRTDWAWAQRLGNVQGESCSDLAVDAVGNAYLVGIFLDTLDLGGLTLSSAGSYDAFVAKFDPNGRVVWAQRGGGAEEDTATSVAVDAEGHVYVTGQYHGPATFGGISIPATTNSHEFVAKYDASGNVLRLYRVDALPWISSGGTDLAVDAAGNVYSVGFIHNSRAEPYYTAGVEMHSPSGSHQWRRTFPVDYTPWDHRIAVDDQTNVFVSGTFWSSLTIGSLTATNHGQASFFLVKFHSGEPEWLRAADMPFDALAFADSLSVDQLGNVLVCGHFTHTMTLGSTELTSCGDTDVFLAKYSRDGELLWLQQAGGPGQDIGKTWSNPAGGIYLASRFQGTASLGDRVIIGDPSHGVYVAALGSQGEPRWVELTGLPESCRFELMADEEGDIHLAGNFLGTASFGTNLLVSAGPADMFLAKLDVPPQPPMLLTPSASQTRFTGQTAVFSVSAEGTPPLHYQWFCDGSPLAGATSDTLTLPALEAANAGRYSVTVWNIGGSVTSEPVTLTILPAPTGPGSVDFSFDLTDNGQVLGMAGGDTGDFSWSSSATVNAIAMLPDGRAFIGGDFVGVNGAPGMNYARLHGNGSVDRSLDSSWGTDGEIVSVAREADGAMLLLGNFSLVNAVPCRYLARVRPDGTVDATFRPTFAFREEWRPMNEAAVQPDGKILICGAFTNVNGVARSSLARLHADGTLDETFNATSVFAANHTSLLPDGRILVEGVFPSLNQPVIRLHADGSHDPTFNLGRPPGVSSFVVFTIGVQPDGKVLVSYGYDDNVARFNSDGSLDPTFQPGRWLHGYVLQFLVQPDGRILVGGEFRTLLGTTQYSVARLDADGTLDETFNAGDAAGPPRWWSDEPKVRALALLPDGGVLVGTQAEGTRASDYGLLRLLPNGARDASFDARLNGGHVAPYTMVPLADGKILINGSFAIVNGVRQPALARLHSDGRIDTTFAPLLVGEYGYVNAINHLLVQPDSRILISGYFTNVDGFSVSELVRLHADGTLDPSFAAQIEYGDVTALTLQPDGRILIGGSFETVGGVRRHHLARLHPDGSLEPSFVPAELEVGDDWYITALGVQSDGRVLVAGHLVTDPSWSGYYGLTRLNPDGSLDADFYARVAADGPVFAMLIQSDDKILFSGGFSLVNGVRMPELARLNPDGTLDSTFHPPPVTYPDLLALAPDGKIFIADWYRTLRLNPDGSVDLRWQSDTAGGVTVLANGDVLFGGSFRSVNGVPVYGMARLHGDLEQLPPVAQVPVTHQTRFAGQDALLRVDACGTGPLSYQWFRDGTPIPGGTDATLTLDDLQPAQAGSYAVVISNPAGSVTGDPVTLEVFPRPTGPGSIDLSFDPSENGTRTGLTGGEPVVSALAVQTDGKLIVGGGFAGIDGIRRLGVARLYPDGAVDLSFDAGIGPNNDVLAAAVQADGKVLIAGPFSSVNGVPRPCLARLEADGALDHSFNPQLEGSESLQVSALALQPDGSIVVGGNFSQVNGVDRIGLVRLLPDGALDPSFNAQPPWPGPFPYVYVIQVQTDGKIVIGADLQGGLARFHPHGALDTAFHPRLDNISAVANVYSIAIQPDGKLIVGGLFSYADGVSRENLARLNADGSLDPTFETSFGNVPGAIVALALRSDGKVVIAGSFQEVNGQLRQRLARLNVDGTLDENYAAEKVIEFSAPQRNALVLQPDESAVVGLRWDERDPAGLAVVRLHEWRGRDYVFNPRFEAVAGPGRRVTINAVALQPDGGVLAGGWLTGVNGQPQTNLARFNPDGQWDPSFAAELGNYFFVNSLALQSDQRIVVGGFGGYLDEDGASHSGVVRLEASGAVDRSFQAPAFDRVHAVAIDAQGKVLVGGEFTCVGDPGVPDEEPPPGPSAIARLNSDGTLDATFNPIHIPAGDDFGVYAIIVQGDGNILIGGNWPADPAIGLPNCLARLQPNGTLDTSFAPTLGSYFPVRAVILQPDGKMLIGGFGQYTDDFGNYRSGLARLNPDGTLDTTFDPGPSFPDLVESLALQADGRIIAGFQLQWNETEAVVRLNPDGVRDPTWHTEAANPGGIVEAKALCVQADGQVLLGGVYQSVSGVPVAGLARLNGATAADQGFVARRSQGAVVQLVATPPPGTSVYAAEDLPPLDWSVSNISHGGVFDEVTGKVKFGPFYDAQARTLSYELVWPPGTQGVFSFTGTASADGLNSPIGGEQFLVLPGPHPADLAPTDWQLSIGEVTGYGAAWRRGETWPVPPVPIPIDYVTRAAALWRGGECYTVDSSVTTEPLWWVNCAPARNALPEGGTAVPQVFNLPPNESNATTTSADFKSAVQQVTNLRYASAVTRRASPTYVPGERVPVVIAVSPGAGTLAYAVEEGAPAGWTITDLSHGGEFDPVNRRVKWGPFFDNTPRTLSYAATPAPTTFGSASFRGVASFDGVSVVVAGTEQMVPSCRMTLGARDPGGARRLSLVGVMGAVYVLDASSDLVNWMPLATLTNTTGRLEFSDPAALQYRQRFYRAHQIE